MKKQNQTPTHANHLDFHKKDTEKQIYLKKEEEGSLKNIFKRQ